MKLTITAAALKKVQAIQQSGDQLVLDLDDGIGVFSDKLLENGLKYRLLAVPSDQIPADFNRSVTSNAGNVKFNVETARYLDENMTLSYKPKFATCQLSSDQALLEPDLVIRRAVPAQTVQMY